MPKSYFSFNGVDSRDWKCYKTQPINFPTPERNFEEIEVPGKNGNIILDNGSYRNVEVIIECFIEGDFIRYFDQMRAYLMRDADYHRLEDDIYPEEYRLASVRNVEAKIATPKKGTIEITLSCKPQRFYKDGDRALPEITGEGTPLNITVAEGFPESIFSDDFINVVGAGLLGNRVMTVVNVSNYAGKLILHYPDDRIDSPEWILGGVSSTDPTTTNGGGTSYGGMQRLMSNTAEVNISDNYMFFETPLYFEIANAGESVFPSTMTIYNPTEGRARPLIRFKYSSELKNQPVCLVNQSPITLTAKTYVTLKPLAATQIESIVVDCDAMDAYAELDGYEKPYNINDGVYMPREVVLKPGENVIRYNNAVDSIEIIPRWWTL